MRTVVVADGEPICFHIGTEFATFDERAKPYLTLVEAFFNQVISIKGCLRDIPEPFHFATKFKKYSQRISEHGEFDFQSIVSTLPNNIANLRVRHRSTSQLIHLHVDVDAVMRSRQLGCYSPMPLVKERSPRFSLATA